jgi:4-diphosphocytidyl-2-C-methyl-D-erythritol kinase
MPTVRLAAPAKVNLFLEVLRRRPDGYHELSSLFQQVSLADELSFAARASDPPEVSRQPASGRAGQPRAEGRAGLPP